MSGRHTDHNDNYPTTSIPVQPADFVPPKVRAHRRGAGRFAIAMYVALPALFLGIGMGATPTEPVASDTPAPAPTVTVTAKPVVDRSTLGPTPRRVVVTVTPKPVVRTVTKTVTKPVAPKSCRDALNYADEGFGYSAEAMKAAQRAFEAISASDLGKLQEQVPIITASGELMSDLAPKYNAAKASCRAAQ